MIYDARYYRFIFGSMSLSRLWFKSVCRGSLHELHGLQKFSYPFYTAEYIVLQSTDGKTAHACKTLQISSLVRMEPAMENHEVGRGYGKTNPNLMGPTPTNPRGDCFESANIWNT